MKRRAVLQLLLATAITPLPARYTLAAERDAAGEARPRNVPSPTVIANLRYAARRGDMQAQYDLAVALDCGLGVRRDGAESLQWFQKAAEQGHVGAQSALGWKYMTGTGVPADDSAAYEWLRRAAEHGNTSAQNNLGILYAQGRGVAADAVEAAKWFRRAAEKGAVDAQRNLEALRAGRSRDVRPSAEPLPPT